MSVSFSPVYGLRVEILEIDPSYTLGNLERERQTVLDSLVRDHPDLVWLEAGQYITANQLLPRPAVMQRLGPDFGPRLGWLARLPARTGAESVRLRICDRRIPHAGAGARGRTGHLQSVWNASEQPGVPYDAVVIVRGGGSQLDFGSFDTHLMGQMVAGFGIPILAGIGHERNVSITDLLCHESVKTPTKAAAFLIGHNRQFEENCLQLANRLHTVARESLHMAREQVDIQTDRLRFVTQLYIRNRHTDLTEKAVTLRHLDPARVLKRGYALLMRNGRILTKTDGIRPGETLQVTMHDGTLDTVVNQSVSQPVGELLSG